ncbi:NAD(P)H-dependent oxidoreductase [Kiloniella sp. b19]|uniref:NAD(P)H-dependent oxidoreductase n=1 Tax=Kiloniella sp. GXU_MW_B19 TaxID=3141326 RepID=UPI0031DC517E
MPRLLVNYAHPGQRHSRVNKAMAKEAAAIEGITFIDLYAYYPRLMVDIDQEQQRLMEHDIIVFQFPLFWYSTPAMVKEWLDLVLEPGFAYGEGGDKLAGKSLLLALTAGSPQEAYSGSGYQGAELTDFLLPLRKTAEVCQMNFLSPYVLFDSLGTYQQSDANAHIKGYRILLNALHDELYDFEEAAKRDLILCDDIPLVRGVNA